MKVLLITGATGFIGSHVIEYLLKTPEFSDYQLVTLGSRAAHGDVLFVNSNNYTFSKQDFIDTGIDQIDTLIHIGAFTPKSGSEANLVAQSLSNIDNTSYLLNNLPSLPKKCLFMSTLDVYANTSAPINEGSTTKPGTLYGSSKLFCEDLVVQWALQNNVIPQILRIGHIYGPGEDQYRKLIPVVLEAVIRGESPKLTTSGEEMRAFLYIEDACRLLIQAVMLNEYVGPINLVSARAVSVNKIVQTIINISGKQVGIEQSKNAPKGRDTIFDPEKMHNLLGMESVSLHDGLLAEYQYFTDKYSEKPC